MREAGCRPVVIRLGLAVEPGSDPGIDMDRDFRAAIKGLLDLCYRGRRDLRVFLGEMQDQRAADAGGEIQRELDVEAVIRNRTIDPGLSRGRIGEPAAEAEAERANLAGAFAAAAQRLDGRRDGLGFVGDGEFSGQSTTYPSAA